MTPRSHTGQHDQIWAMGTEDTILSLIKGSFWEYGPFENGSILQKRKTEMYVSLNQKNREMTMLKSLTSCERSNMTCFQEGYRKDSQVVICNYYLLMLCY